MLAMIAAWKHSAQSMVDHADKYVQMVTFPGGQPWSGQTRDAAVGTAQKDQRAIAEAREAIDAMADAAARGINDNVIPALGDAGKRTGVRGLIAAAEAAGFEVHDDLSVTDPTRKDGDAPDIKRTQDRDNFAREIPKAAQTWWDAERAVADQINTDKATVATSFNTTATVNPFSAAELSDIRRLIDQAIVDLMAKIRGTKKALDDALNTAYTNGLQSEEGKAALKRADQLKKELADQLDTLGKLPDYSQIDPRSVHTEPDGGFTFEYKTPDGKTVQVRGQLNNGTGNFFDENTQTTYMFQNGKLTNAYTLDEGRVEAKVEPLFTAVSLVAGGGAVIKAVGEWGWQGIKALFTREALSASSGIGAGGATETVTSRAIVAAEQRAEIAAHNLATGPAEHAPIPHPPAAASGEHTPPVTVGEHHTPGHVPEIGEPPVPAQIAQEVSALPPEMSRSAAIADRVTALDLSQEQAAQVADSVSKGVWGGSAGIATLPDGRMIVLPKLIDAKVALMVNTDGSVTKFTGDLYQFLPYLK
ncbi:hypothetical protein BKN37_15545 [Mycobacterium talmoniae]|uniref:Uncharacterized protein n=1 Tax=Mycobacterium talmoniae TaxID=1858794 RepID=A0A1S1NCL0_9MYCO|nr:hypothetical protein BKN37_15545 [Mycobacterium talmoniae]